MRRLFSDTEASAALAGLLMLMVTCGAQQPRSLPDGRSCAPIQPSSAGR